MNHTPNIQPSSPATHLSRVPELLHSHTAQSGVDLFAAYGIDLCPVAMDADAETVANIAFVTVVGFTSPDFSGFVGLGTTHKMLRRSNRTASSSRDWTAELANQLLGRLKNRLLREGIMIHRVPAATIQGCPPSLFCSQTCLRPISLISDNEPVFIWIEAEPSLATAEELPPADTEVLAEGEMVLF